MKIIIFYLVFAVMIISSAMPATPVITPGDTLQIQVENEPDLSQTVKVSQNGTIAYPFIGEVNVAGLTVDETIQLLQELLKKSYIDNTKIHITVSSSTEKENKAPVETSVSKQEAITPQVPETSTAEEQSILPAGENSQAGSEVASDIQGNVPAVSHEGVNESPYDQPTTPETKTPEVSKGQEEGKETVYRIIPYDTLEISVYGEKDLNQTVSVSEAGTIRLPLIGEVKVAGLTSDETAKKIEQMLSKGYVLKPQVSVLIKEHGKIYIFGAVKQPGSYELKGPLTVVDAVVLAGGTKDNANLSKIKIIKKEAKEYVVDLETQGRNFFLAPLDKVVVEEYGQIFIVGAVNNPGVYNLEKSNLSPLDAILFLSNGTKENANLSAVKVIREENGKRTELVLDLDNHQTKFFLKEGDRVLVELYKDIYIFGQVKVPGKYSFKKGLTAIDAISLAGGFTDVADKNGVKIIRGEGEKKKAIKVPIGYILSTGNKSRNVELREGDTISVSESWF